MSLICCCRTCHIEGLASCKQVWGAYIYQDAHMATWVNIISIIWAVIKHQAGEQVSSLKLFCMMAYQTNTKE